MKFNLGKYKEKIRSVNYSESFFNFLGGKNRWIIFTLLLGLTVFSGYVWYRYQYNPGWSREQKEAYINSKEKEIVLDEEKFNKIVMQQEKRKAEYGQKIENLEDIFRLGERLVK